MISDKLISDANSILIANGFTDNSIEILSTGHLNKSVRIAGAIVYSIEGGEIAMRDAACSVFIGGIVFMGNNVYTE